MNNKTGASNLRPTTRECVYLVEYRKWGQVYMGQMTKSTVSKHCGNIGTFDIFCSCDLDLDPMTFICKPKQYPLEIYQICKNELHMSMLSKVIVLQTYRQTQPKLYTYTTSPVINIAPFLLIHRQQSHTHMHTHCSKHHFACPCELASYRT